MPTPPEPSPELPRPQAISLDELTEAFAQAMGYRKPSEPPSQPPPVVDVPPAPPPQPETPVDQSDACPITPTSILEAMLFVGNSNAEPLTPQQAAELMRGVEPGEIAGLVDGLNRRYTQRGCPYEIVGEGAGYRLTLRAAFNGVRQVFYGKVREARLSQAAIDVLALVAYRQPITADEVQQMRGRPSSRLLAQLVRRGLLRIERAEAMPRVAHYRTAERFLRLFGLENLDDLPHSEELDHL